MTRFGGSDDERTCARLCVSVPLWLNSSTRWQRDMNLHLTLTLVTALLVSSPVAAQYSVRRRAPSSSSRTRRTRRSCRSIRRSATCTREMTHQGAQRPGHAGHSVPGAVGEPARRAGVLRQRQASTPSTWSWATCAARIRSTASSARRASGRSSRRKADGASAWVTSRLEFFRQPAWMAQFPFAHTIEMTHRLKNGALEIAAALHNLSAEPMPVAIGFHPYFS